MVFVYVTRGMADDQRVVNCFSAAAFLHILLSITNHYYDDDASRSVLGISRDWESAFLEHFPLPRCTCLLPEVWQVIRELWIPSVLLLSCTSCSALLIIIMIMIMSPGVCLEDLGPDYVHFNTTFLYHGAYAYLISYGSGSESCELFHCFCFPLDHVQHS